MNGKLKRKLFVNKRNKQVSITLPKNILKGRKVNYMEIKEYDFLK